MGPLEALAKNKIEERKREMQDGKGTDSRDLLSLMCKPFYLYSPTDN